MQKSFFFIVAGFLEFSAASMCMADEQTAGELIDKLGLEKSSIPASEMNGWQKPDTIVVRVDGPDRLEWYRRVLPDDVTLIPAANEREAAARSKDAQAAVGFCSQRLVDAAPRLHWIHIPYAGVARCVEIPKVASGRYLVTNMQRLGGPQIAEHAIAMMFYFARGLDHYSKAQTNKIWNSFTVPPGQLWAIRNKTLLVVGLGGIGTQVARLASGLGMRVIAIRNSRREGPDFIDYIGLSDELETLVSEVDVVVNSLPLTDKTQSLFDSGIFSRMKSSALFINVGRGKTVVTADLIKALESGEIAGAGLDVQDPEPVPEQHPLWTAPNLLITPHSSSFSDSEQDTSWLIFRENLRRYVAGEKILSVVNVEQGY